MRKYLSLFICMIWTSYCLATSVSLSEKNVSAVDAEKLGFHRLIDGTSNSWDDSWIIFIYPQVDANGYMASEVCLEINEGAEKLVSTCIDMNGSEIKGFNRSDIKVSKQRTISLDVSITYGSEIYLIKNIVSLPGKDYENFKKTHNK